MSNSIGFGRQSYTEFCIKFPGVQMEEDELLRSTKNDGRI
jgi:hypothetical protein